MESSPGLVITSVFFIIMLWGLAGIIALIWSLICMGKSGTNGEKFVGILIAFLLGPLYFIYYAFDVGHIIFFLT
jgi:hypothetical protein